MTPLLLRHHFVFARKNPRRGVISHAPYSWQEIPFTGFICLMPFTLSNVINVIVEVVMSICLIPETHAERLERLLTETRKELGNLRRGLFARHSELARRYQETYFELELLKSSIAKQDVKIWTSRASNVTHCPKKRDFSPDLFSLSLKEENGLS